jgi:protein SCO1/2
MLTTRRSFLAGCGAALLCSRSGPVLAHNNAGVVSPPVPPPAVQLDLDDGRSTTLAKLLHGRVTALQMMFTSCKATCPIQGAVFGHAAKALGDTIPTAQWLSISIDPERDDPKALAAWMKRFGSHPRWRAGRPTPTQLTSLVDFLKSAAPGPDRHTAQVYFFDRKGQLTMRSVDFPPSTELTRVIADLAKR